MSSLRRSSRSFKFSKKSTSQKSTEVASGFSQEESGVGKASSAAYVSEGGVDEKRNSQVSFAEGIVQDGDCLEMNVDDGNNEDGPNVDQIEEGEKETTDQGEEGEKDAIDELERIVEA